MPVKGFPDQDVFVGIVADAGEWTVDLGPWAWLIFRKCPIAGGCHVSSLFLIYGWLLAVELKQSTRP